MRNLAAFAVIGVLLTFGGPPLAVAGVDLVEGEWTRIDAPPEFTDASGKERKPSCIGNLTPITGETPSDSEYAFFVRKGDSDRLAIFFDGGGACWDVNTCIGTALAGQPIYSQTIGTPGGPSGLADIENAENPIAEYTQVFIPYCSGDLHTGSADVAYDPRLLAIRHRGADNVAFVLDWIRSYYREKVGYAPREVFLSGASAGGYGVTYHYPAIDRMLPWYTRIRVLVDAANGVITDDFYRRTLTPNGVWNVWENLAPELQPAFASGADRITVELFKTLAYSYPGTRFGQYTTAFDETQIAFFNLARNTDRPDLWEDPTELALSAFEWTIRARTYMNLVALQTWNYRYYIAAGGDHTIVGDDKFYTENSAQGVFFADWVDDMINRRWLWWGNDWRNVSCTPNCL